MRATQALFRRVRHFQLTTKQGPKDYYKGTGSGRMGRHTKHGGYRIDYRLVRTYVVPSGLDKFKVSASFLKAIFGFQCWKRRSWPLSSPRKSFLFPLSTRQGRTISQPTHTTILGGGSDTTRWTRCFESFRGIVSHNPWSFPAISLLINVTDSF